MEEYCIGQIVKSKAGRDKAKYFIIVDIEDEFVYLADGRIRRLEKPKKKKVKHIQATKNISEDVRQKLMDGIKMNNADIRKVLKAYEDKEEIE